MVVTKAKQGGSIRIFNIKKMLCLSFKIFDVTWRYSANHDQVRLRRTDVSENWLVSTIGKMNEQVYYLLNELILSRPWVSDNL